MQDHFSCENKDCDARIFIYNPNCPDCGKNYYPNVRLTQIQEEKDALDIKYNSAVEKVRKAGKAHQQSLDIFEQEVKKSTKAVQSISIEAFYAEFAPNFQFSTYHARIKNGTQIPQGDKFELWRQTSETELYRKDKDKVHFLALSLDKLGLPNYGSVHVHYKNQIMNRQAITYYENNVVWHKELGNSYEYGLRASWENRAKLTVSKHFKKFISNKITPANFQSILLTRGASSIDDRCMEVHAWEPLNVRAVERVVFDNRVLLLEAGQLAALKEKLLNLKISMEVI